MSDLFVDLHTYVCLNPRRWNCQKKGTIVDLFPKILLY